MEPYKNNSSKGKYNAFARFSTVGIQMGVIIVGFALLGNYLDKKFQSDTPWWTLGLVLFGIGAGLTLVIREAMKMSNRNNEKE